jgi:hypothetical protein
MTELFFEGAEPALDEFPLQDLLDLFPEGEYEFDGTTVDNTSIGGTALFTHAIPDGPHATATVTGNSVRISWTPVSAPPPGFPDETIDVVLLPGPGSGDARRDRARLGPEPVLALGVRRRASRGGAPVRGAGHRPERQPDDERGLLRHALTSRSSRSTA